MNKQEQNLQKDQKEFISKSLKIKDSDIATIEALHDLLLDAEGYPLNHPTLKKSRDLTAKLYKIVGYNSANENVYK